MNSTVQLTVAKKHDKKYRVNLMKRRTMHTIGSSIYQFWPWAQISTDVGSKRQKYVIEVQQCKRCSACRQHTLLNFSGSVLQ